MPIFRYRSWFWPLVFAVVVISRPTAGTPSVAPQQAPPQPPTQQPPPFRVEVNYIRVDVFPTLNGQPVTDLRQDDFEILEDRVPQKIAAFEHVTIRGGGPQDARVEPNTVAESRAMLSDPRARVFVLFLDTYHVDVGASHRIRAPLINTLDRTIGQNDLVGVMTPEMAATDVTFARKTGTIEGILTKYWYWGERDRINAIDPEEERYRACYPGTGPDLTCPDDDRGVAQEMIDRRREKRTIDALQDLVRFLHGVREERKAVLVISDGWRLFRPNERLARRLYCRAPGTPEIGIDPRTGKITTRDTKNPIPNTMYECDRDRLNLARIDNDDTFRRILDEANRANTSFYPIDPRGLVVFDEPIGPNPPPPPSIDRARLTARLTSLRTLAEATDGIAIVDTNDLTRGLQRVVSDLTSYYLLAYYSTNTKLDGKFRSITVRVKRPGVQVRARRGYVAPTEAEVAAARSLSTASGKGGAPSPGGFGGAGASADGLPGTAEAETRAIEAVIATLSGLARELPLRVQVAAGWTPHSAQSMVWAVGELGGGEAWKGGAEADVMLTDAAGSTLATARAQVEPGSRSFRVTLAPAGPLAPGDYVVRVRARGMAPGVIPAGEVLRITLPPSPDGAGALFVRRGPATANREMATADRRFRRSEQLRVEVPTPLSDPMTARLLDRTGQPIPVPVTPVVRDDADGSRWQTVRLALAPLAAGDYIIELTSEAATARKRTLIAFRVVP